MVPSIKKITDNIYQYCPRHCDNGGPQLKFIYFYQSYSPFLASPTLRLIVAIDATYHLTICISDVTNAFQNTLKASSRREIIDCPPHYRTYFKFRFPTIHIEPSTYGLYGVEIYIVIQVTKTSGRQWNTIINMFLYSLIFSKHAIDHVIYTLIKPPSVLL